MKAITTTTTTITTTTTTTTKTTTKASFNASENHSQALKMNIKTTTTKNNKNNTKGSDRGGGATDWLLFGREDEKFYALQVLVHAVSPAFFDLGLFGLWGDGARYGETVAL